MMPYIQRDSAGKIIGQFACLQHGFAEEFLQDGDLQLQPLDHNAFVLAQIESIEKNRQPRAVRDFALTGDKTRLQKIDADIAALRTQLVV